MKKLLAVLCLVFPFNAFALDYYSVSSGYEVGDKFHGELASVIFDGYDASVIDGFANGFNVKIDKQNENQVLVTFLFKSNSKEDDYEIQAEVVIDLGKKVELILEQSKFYFHIKHLGS
ncbi:hypothetical protein [Alteromonas flava]|uniref:hypothetical protein n=1 Tax=Alteromonas flava TaxID=2048003 RepID=UPI000C28C6B0|nr:hypothetical protein [Alteromonas flava]